jgi:thioredoxin reductase
VAERTSRAAEQTTRKGEVDGGEARYDAVVVGAGAAGLSAALVLGRSRRRVLILDGGEPRNAPSSGAHGFFTRDGAPPKELLRIGREQLTPYEGVQYRRTKARKAGGTSGAFEVVLEDGSTVFARRLILATGVADELPDRPGFSELWGRGVYHCPYCHGWEVRDRPLAVLNSSGAGAVERAVLIRNWSRDLVLLTDGPAGLDEKSRRRLSGLGVSVREERISRLEGDSGRESRAASGGLERIVFEDGSTLAREGLFYVPPQSQRSELAEALGCDLEQMARALVIKSDPTTRETSVPGVYAAGDVTGTGPLQSIPLAAASGAAAAYFANHALATEDADAELAALAAGAER